jgi:hypothetical protein
MIHHRKRAPISGPGGRQRSADAHQFLPVVRVSSIHSCGPSLTPL